MFNSDSTDIPVKKIFVAENSRAEVKPEEVERMMVSFQQMGQLHAIGVMPVRRGRGTAYQLVFGETRLRAAEKLDWKTIKCVVGDADMREEDALITNISENLHRRNTSAAEAGRVYFYLREKKGMTEGQIAARVGENISHVKNCISAFYDVPAKYRTKVISKGNLGGGKKGFITAATAQKLVSIGKTNGLGTRQIEPLFDYATKDNVSEQNIRGVAALLAQGSSVKNAIKRVSDIRTVDLRVPMSKRNIAVLEARYGKKIHDIIQDRLSEDQELGVYKKAFFSVLEKKKKTKKKTGSSRARA